MQEIFGSKHDFGIQYLEDLEFDLMHSFHNDNIYGIHNDLLN